MKSMWIIGVTIASLLVLMSLVLGTIYGKLDGGFWKDFLSNGLATFIGAGLGIPIALWISRHQERRTEKERKKKILVALKQELNRITKSISAEEGDEDIDNLIDVDKFLDTDLDCVKTAVKLTFELSTEIWDAFSDGGELEWIKDPELLMRISSGYRAINYARRLSESYLEILKIHIIEPKTAVLSYIVGGLRVVDGLLKEMLETSLIHIEEALKELK